MCAIGCVSHSALLVKAASSLDVELAFSVASFIGPVSPSDCVISESRVKSVKRTQSRNDTTRVSMMDIAKASEKYSSADIHVTVEENESGERRYSVYVD